MSKYSCESFFELISKLDALDALGIATLMNISLYRDKDKKEPKDGIDILIEIAEKFKTYPRSRRKVLIKMIKQMPRGDKNE